MSSWILCVSVYPTLVYPAWDSLCFLDMDDCFLSHVREVLSYCLFRMFSHVLFLSCPSGTPIMWMLLCLILAQKSLRLTSFLFFFLSLFCDFYHSVFLVTYLFFCFSYSAVDSFQCIFHFSYCIIHLCSLVPLGLC